MKTPHIPSNTLVFSQLFYDGHHSVAIELSSIIRADPPCPPSDKLMNLMAKHVKDDLPKETNIYEEIAVGIGKKTFSH